MRKIQDPEANMGEIVQMINYDPGMTSNILKLSNSSVYGCARKISSLRDALVRLGLKNVQQLITAAVAGAAIKTKIRGYGINSTELWDHSIAVAVAAENLADILELPGEKIAFTAGLLHDIGKVLTGKFLIDKKMRKIFQNALSESTYLPATEAEVLGIDHAGAGGFLLNEWNIPDNLVEAVRYHHEPLKTENPNAAVINIADVICVQNDIGLVYSPPKNVFDEALMKKMNVTDSVREEVIIRTKDSFETIKDVFSNK
jgi:putative nucleotidyltransferase with HDIG domain